MNPFKKILILGNFVHGKRHSELPALFIRPDGSQYEGTWLNDMKVSARVSDLLVNKIIINANLYYADMPFIAWKWYAELCQWGSISRYVYRYLNIDTQ
jgi:hypothetical protein